MAEEQHRRWMAAAIARDGEAQRALMDGDAAAAGVAFAEAAELYRRSWEAAPPASYGRLVGMLKAAVLAGDAGPQARYVRDALGDQGAESPTASYAQAIAALIESDDQAAARWAGNMLAGSEPFQRTAKAIEALARRDRAGYSAALESIVRDFEERADHLTGVAIADTAAMLERLAAARTMAAGIDSPVLPHA